MAAAGEAAGKGTADMAYGEDRVESSDPRDKSGNGTSAGPGRDRPGRGHLRIYLGSAAGVGKSYAMLGEGHRRAERGADVVVAFAEAHGRPHTAALLDGLEVVPRHKLEYRGSVFEEMDLDAVLARRPEIALVDEFAHTNVPGSRNEKRWQDVEELLDAGIDVISAVNIQHLESLNDVVEKITGVPQRETVPDAVVRAADQVEMVDMTPEALRRRMAHGNIYPPEKIDAALTNYFRSGNLSALRELALLWLADKVDEGLQRYRIEHKITGAWEARERVVVALTGGPEGRTLIRRAARIAARSSGGDLLAVHITKSDGLTGADPAALASQRRLVESVGGSYHQVVGDDIPEALLTFARAENATQLVLGASRRSWLTAMLTGPGIGSRTIRGSGDIDVHIVTHGQMGRGRGLPRPRGAITLRRKIAGYALAAALSPALTAVLTPFRVAINLTSDVLVFTVAVILVALVGGFAPAMLTAIVGSLLLNYYFIKPIHQFTIAQANNVLAIGVFIAVAIMVSAVVDIAARRTKQAARANAESELLATTAGSVLRGQQGLSALLDRVREAFGMDSVTLLEQVSPDGNPGGDRRPDAEHDGQLARRRQPRRARRHQAGGRRRRGAGGRLPLARPARQAAAGLGPAGPGCVRLLCGRCPGPAAAGGRGAGGQADRGRRQDAHRTARRRQPRPAHAAGLREGRRDQPALAGGEVDRGRPRGTARDGRRVAGPAHPPGRQPAGHEQAAGRGAVAVPASGRPGRDRLQGAG